MLRKFAKTEVLDVKSSSERAASPTLSSFADLSDYKTDDGFLYVRVRAISSRVNKNKDGWPAGELKKAYRTFVGKPLFVDHHNSDPKKARGVVVDAALHVEDDIEKVASSDSYYASAPAEHLPPTWIELLLEVDAKRFPKLAKAIIAGDIDGVSMGANVERSKCSHCGNWATTPDDYCQHVRSKGAHFDYTLPDGTKTSKMAYEDCYDIGFFELSFVFDPADETALTIDKRMARRAAHVEVLAEADGPRTALAKVAGAFGEVPAWEGEPAEFGAPRPDAGLADPDPSDSTGEQAQVENFRLQQYVNAGMDPEQAAELARRNDVDWHAVVEYIRQGADPGTAARIVSRTAHVHPVSDDEFMWGRRSAHGVAQAVEAYRKLRLEGVPSGEAMDRVAEQYFGGDRATAAQAVGANARLTGSTRTADNPPPQSEMTTAPDEVDTLRQDRVCPICGSDMEDGICEVCNYEEPPEGFNNPDLEKAKETDLREEQADAQDATQGSPAEPTPGEGPQAGMEGAPGMPQPIQSHVLLDFTAGTVTVTAEPQAASASSVTVTGFRGPAAPVIGEGTTSERTARTNSQERPILPATRKLTDKPKNQTTVKDSKKPVESNRKGNSDMTETQKTADGATPVGEGVAADKRVDVEGVGAVTADPLSGIESENVEKDTGDFVADETETWTEGKGDSLGQADAVNSDTGDFNTVSSTEKTADIEVIETIPSGNGFPDHDPSHVDLEALLSEEVGDRTETDSTGTAFRSLEQASPVTKGESGSDVGGPIGVAVASARARLMKAMKVAEVEVGLGITEPDAKFDRTAELEEADEAALDARLDTLSKVRTAGLRRAAASPTQRTAGARSLPSLQNRGNAGGSGFLHEAAAADAQVAAQVEDAIGW